MKIEENVLNHFFEKELGNSNCYLSLPNIETPRIIVPLKSFKTFCSGLAIQNTASIKNRIIKLMLPVLYPVFKYYNKRKLSITSNFSNELKAIYSNFNIVNAEEISIYVGTPKSSNRKLSILLMDKNGNSIGIVKYPLGRESEKFIANEYNTFCHLKNIDFSSICLPRNFDLLEINGKKILFQENIFTKTSQLKNELNYFIINASIELALNTKHNGIKDYSVQLLDSLKVNKEIDNKIILKVKEILNSFVLENIPIILLHGDFVLYNMQTDGKKLCLIDWEYSRKGLPLFDLFHFVFQGKYQIDKKSIEKCIKNVFYEKNLVFYFNYLDQLMIKRELIKPLFIIYLINEMLFYQNIYTTQFSKDHFYEALKLMVE